jgi:wobble nucleotide-excising tRNase
MLLKLDSIEEIGRFQSLKHKAPQFSRLTLVFARNGFGKSTICAVLRSVATNEPNHISSRRRLDAKSECKVQSQWQAIGNIGFSSGVWSQNPDKVFVFDAEYVHQNLHVGDSVTRDNKRSLLPVVLGDAGVELAAKIVTLDSEQRDLSTKMTASENVIRAACPVVGKVDVSAFCAKVVPDDIDDKIVAANRDVELAKHAALIKQKADPQSFSISTFDHYQAVAARTVSDASEDASTRVQKHIDDHKLHPRADNWIKYGVERIENDSCPFCAQSVVSLDLVAAYKAYFSDAFAALTTERDNTITELEALCSDTNNQIDKIVANNDADFEFWRGVCEIKNAPVLDHEQRTNIKLGLNLLLELLKQKVANPLVAVPLGEHAKVIKDSCDALITYNNSVAAQTVTITAARGAVATSDAAKADENLQKWVALKSKQSEPLLSETASYGVNESRKAQIEIEKKAKQTELTNFASATIGTRQNDINNLLEDFGANFSIADTKANFVGREPNTEYCIALGTGKIKAGDRSDSEPSFKTVLSAGDKTTLALAFFISQIKADPKLADAVVVFDDPFSSQDLSRQFGTTSHIRAIAETAAQTLVFSHDPRFLQKIKKDADQSITSTYQILCNDDGNGSIMSLSLDDELKELYVRQSEAIREYAGRQKLLTGFTDVSLIQALRPFLEDYIRARYPGRFQTNDMLSPMTDAIEAAGAADALFSTVADLKAINEYTRPNHHGGATIADPTELRTQCKKVVRIIGAF